MERLYCPHCGAGHFASDSLCLNCKQALRGNDLTTVPVPPAGFSAAEAEKERHLLRIFKIAGWAAFILFGTWFWRLFGPCTIVVLLVPTLLVYLWELRDNYREEERGRRILAAGSDKAAVQAELARYHSDKPRLVQTRYGVYEVSAFDSRLGSDAPSKDTDR